MPAKARLVLVDAVEGELGPVRSTAQLSTQLAGTITLGDADASDIRRTVSYPQSWQTTEQRLDVAVLSFNINHWMKLLNKAQDALRHRSNAYQGIWHTASEAGLLPRFLHSQICF